MKSYNILLGLVLVFFISMSVVSAAMFISDTSQDSIYPGEEGSLVIEVENNFDYDVDDVSVFLDLSQTVGKNIFSSVGGSEKSVDEIREDKTKSFTFTLKASSSAEPGDYNVPYIITYYKNDSSKTISGKIGVTINSKTKLDFTAYADSPILNQKTRLNLRIINKGFGDIKFVSVQIEPEGYKLLSEAKKFIGDIASNDYDTSNFDVIFTKENARLVATVSYLDFENNEKIEFVDLPLEIYSASEAQKLGLIKSSKVLYYVIIIVVIVLIILGIRRYRKKKLARSKFE